MAKLYRLFPDLCKEHTGLNKKKGTERDKLNEASFNKSWGLVLI